MDNKSLIELQKLDEDGIARLYMRVFNTDDGRLVLEDLRQRCFMYIPTFSDNAILMAQKEGMRSVVLSIETRLRPVTDTNNPKEEEDE